MLVPACSNAASVGWKTAKRFPPAVAQATAHDAALSAARPTGFALHRDSLFFARAKKSKQKKARPCIRVLLRKTSLAPASLQGSSRWDVPVPSFLARRPCLAPSYATPALGLLKGIGHRVVWRPVGWKTAKHFPPQSTRPLNLARQDRWVSFALPTLRLIHTNALLHGPADATKPPLSEGRMESLRRGTSGMDAARAVKGHGWPLRGGPRSSDGTREVERSETRMQGQAFLLTFFATEKSESPSRAKPVARAEKSAATYMCGRASTASQANSLLRQQKHAASLSGEHAFTAKVPQC